MTVGARKMAFPSTPGQGIAGMGLRDWYAGLAMQALISRMENWPTENEFDRTVDRQTDMAFKYADAMVKRT